MTPFSSQNSFVRPKRVFTLKDVQVRVSEHLASGQRSEFGSLKPPAMPTLKLWSKQRLFIQSESLEGAAALVLEKVLHNAGRYKQIDPPGTVSNAEKTAETVEVRAPALLNQDIRHLLVGMQALQKDVVSIADELKRLNDIVNSMHAHNAPTAPVPLAISPELSKAIEQLDALRKHTLLSCDREIQLMRQQQGAQQGRQFESASALDIQRVLARVSNVESLAHSITQAIKDLRN